MLREPRTRVELDERLRKSGLDGKLFKDPETREKARWIEKQIRTGSLRKTINL